MVHLLGECQGAHGQEEGNEGGHVVYFEGLMCSISKGEAAAAAVDLFYQKVIMYRCQFLQLFVVKVHARNVPSAISFYTGHL